MRIVDRLFTQIRPKSNYDEDAAKSLSDFFNKQAIVVLGDPGSGKTTSFLNAAETEKNAVYVRIRDFLALDVKKRWKDKTLYLDGLDEQRAKTEDGSAVLDQIRCRLVRGANRVYWYATGFLLNPDSFSDKLIRYIGKSEKN